MPSLTQLAQEALRPVIQPGDLAIDATAGNGHDTCFLAELVGETGRVLAFDNQAAAIAQTSHRLVERGFTQVTLLCRDHCELRQCVSAQDQGRVAAIMWNLGYLPGGDKAHVTQIDSTRQSLCEGLSLLRRGGRATVLAYPGHAGGTEECVAVTELLESLSREDFRVEKIAGQAGRAVSPQLFVIERIGGALGTEGV